MFSFHYLTSSLRMRRTSSFFYVEPSSDSGADLAESNGGQNGQPLHSIGTLYRTSKWLCYLTTCLAFVLGVGVGVALPFTMLVASSSVGSPAAANLSALRTPLTSQVSINLTSIQPTGQANRLKARSRKKAQLVTMRNRHLEKGVESAVEDASVSFVDLNGVPSPLDGDQQSQVSSETVQGVYWSQAVEDILPKGFDRQQADEWSDFSRQSPIWRVEEGCGRMQNRLIAFENGRQSCCRYRQNYDQIQGEIFSYYLGQLLGLPNLPPSSLAIVRPRDRQWINVQSAIRQAQWTEDRPIVYTQFLDGLEPAGIPVQLRSRQRHLNPADVKDRRLRQDSAELIQLAQWSDLIVFDYLTANLDRMVNNMHNMQWNPAMMDAPAHNLARHPHSGLLVFLDNESGLLHGYRLLDKYEIYHKSLLDSLCVFRKNTIDSLRRLQANKDIGARLRQMFENRDQPVVDYLPFLPEKSIKILNYRIDQVLDRVTKCESVYSS